MTESWEQTRLAHRDRQAAWIAASALALVIEHGAPALTMAAIAEQAAISRQTLYRYYQDVDAVLVGVAELATAHDEDLAHQVAEQPDVTSQLDLIARAATHNSHQDPAHTMADHRPPATAALEAMLPPAGRRIIADHEARARRLLSLVLRRGMDDGTFRPDLSPEADAPLIFGLLAAADPHEPERAVSIVHQLVRSSTHHEEQTR